MYAYMAQRRWFPPPTGPYIYICVLSKLYLGARVDPRSGSDSPALAFCRGRTSEDIADQLVVATTQRSEPDLAHEQLKGIHDYL